MTILWIILIIVIAIIIERIIICSKKSFIINPYKINHIVSKNKDFYIISADIFKLTKDKDNIIITSNESNNNQKVIIKGNIYDIPVHVSEKLKRISFNRLFPINSLCSIWNCYTDVASGNVLGNYKLISTSKINNVCICNNELYVLS